MEKIDYLSNTCNKKPLASKKDGFFIKKTLVICTEREINLVILFFYTEINLRYNDKSIKILIFDQEQT